MGIEAVRILESVAGLIARRVACPTPGSLSKKYSRSVTGPLARLLAEVMKKGWELV
jgi:hypothetical protein